MAMATTYADGVGYGARTGPMGLEAAVAEYGENGSELEDANIVRASRLIDSLRMKDVPDTFPRWRAGQTFDNRIMHAVGLIALHLPDGGAAVPRPERVPQTVTAGPLSVSFGADIQPSQSHDEIRASALGIPDVRAYRLLRPYLADSGVGVGSGVVVAQVLVSADSLLDA